MIDLHTHSTKSDGTFKPCELVDYAIKKGISAFALTDHDTVDGLDEITEYAKSLKKQGIINVPEVIPGIELSTNWQGAEVHIVGLYIDWKSPAFVNYLKEFVDSRELRNETMCKNLAADGIEISLNELKEVFPDTVITRAHFAKLLLEKGYVSNRDEAFDKYLGNRTKYYVPRENITPERAIELILSADGVPVFAHPILCRISDARLDELVGIMKNAGLMGIEAVYSTYVPSEERQIRGLAEKYHLLLSGGSDFHGANKKHIDMGIGMGKLYVPEEFLMKINQSRKNLLFTDMDGTLLRSDSTISPAMKEAIDRLTSNGHQLILTSGRPLPSILEVKEFSGLNYPNMWVISYNGGLVYNCDKKIPVFTSKLDYDTIKTIVDICVSEGVHIHAYSETEVIGFEKDEEVSIYLKRIHLPFKKTDDIAGSVKEGTYKLQIIHLTDHTKLERVRDRIIEKVGDKTDSFYSNNKYLEIMPKGVSKGAAILFLEKLLAMPHSHTFAAGDAENDISMLKAAGTGIAVANANDEVKKSADIITKKDNEHDGLIEIIDKYFCLN